MFDLLFTSSNFNESELNFTIPINFSSVDIENGNASRHFANVPGSPGMVYRLSILILASLSFIPCLLIILFSLFSFSNCKKFQILSGSRRVNEEGGNSAGSGRPDLLSIVQSGVASDQMIFQHGEEVAIIDTPSSMYTSDMLPGYSDSSRNLHSDTITTPLSNNSIITMTMRNNYLIVETEERVPVNCSTVSSEELYSSTLPDFSHYPQSNNVDFHCDDVLDDYHHCYSDEHLPNLCLLNGCQDESFYYKPTTSRQADEEDQHVELFHKNILAFPSTSSSCEQEPETAVDLCNYETNKEIESSLSTAAASSTTDNYSIIEKSMDLPPINITPQNRIATLNTGFTQSDSSGSSTSSPYCPQFHHVYGSQREYEDCEFPLPRKRASSLKLINCYERDKILDLVHSSSVSAPSASPSLIKQSVLQVTNCSFPEISEPSN